MCWSHCRAICYWQKVYICMDNSMQRVGTLAPETKMRAQCSGLLSIFVNTGAVVRLGPYSLAIILMKPVF